MTAPSRMPAARRWTRRVAAVLSGAVVVLNAVPVSPARADSPVVQTWWTFNNLAFEFPVPGVLPPGAVPPVTIPVTDVPDGGSEVAGTQDQPTGALTLRYEFPEGSTLGPLVLTVAEGVPPAPATELVACPLTGDGRFETHPTGGPIAELPESDCSRSVPGTLSEDGTTFRFEDVGSLAAEEHLAIAVLPVAGRAILERALGDSLEVTVPDGGSGIVPSRPVAPRAPVPSAPVAAPTFLGQVDVAAPEPAPPAPAPAPAAPEAQPVAARFTTIFHGTAAGDAAGSAVAGLVLVLLAASSVWRRGRAALLGLPPALQTSAGQPRS